MTCRGPMGHRFPPDAPRGATCACGEFVRTGDHHLAWAKASKEPMTDLDALVEGLTGVAIRLRRYADNARQRAKTTLTLDTIGRDLANTEAEAYDASARMVQRELDKVRPPGHGVPEDPVPQEAPKT